MGKRKWIYKFTAFGLAVLMTVTSALIGMSSVNIEAAETITSSVPGFEYRTKVYESGHVDYICTTSETQVYHSYEEAVKGLADISRQIFSERKCQDYKVSIPVKIIMDQDDKLCDIIETDVQKETYKETGNPDEGFSLKKYCYAKGNLLADDLFHMIPYNDGAYEGVFYYFSAGYNVPLERYEEAKAKIDSVMNSLKLDGKSDYEKVKAVMNWISENVNYDHHYYDKPEWEAHTEYPDDMTGAILDGYCTCAGYSNLFYYMATAAGLPALCEAGSNHAWNLVEIDGKYYYIDPTGTHFKNGEPDSEFLKGKTEFLFLYQPYEGEEVEDKYDNISDDGYSKEHSSCKGNHNLQQSGGMLASCEKKGYTAYECTNDGCLYVEREYIEPLGHDWDNGTVTQEADCTHPEITTYKCTRDDIYPGCKETKTEETKEPLGHNYVKEETKKAACTEDGKNTYTCSRCGDSHDEVIPATGHNYTEVVTKEPTCTETGVKTYTCSNCEDSYTETIKKLGHKYIKTVIPATCTVGEIWNMKCSLCGNEENIDMEDPLGHDWGKEEITKQPTCTEDGEKTSICSRCKESKTETIPKTGHVNTEIRNQKDASCEEEGYTGDIYCKECNTLLEKGNSVAATGHKWDNGVVTKEATYTEKGIKTFTCKTCKETKTEDIPVKGHEHHYDNGVVTKEATCTEDGMKTFTCSDCSETYTESIPATGHQHTELRNKKEAACTEPGYTGDTYCKDCKELISAGKAIEAIGHKFDSGKITKEATCKESGLKTFTCEKCKETKTETIPKVTGHAWDKGKVKKEATCKEAGEKLYTCSVCGETKIETVPKLNSHTWNSGKITKEATCTANGEKTYTCSVCGETKKESISKTGHKFGKWIDISKATVFAPATHKRTCKECGATETESYGSKLKPAIKVNASSLKLKKKQSTKKFVVSGLAKGDYVKSWVTSNKKMVTVSGKSNGTCTIKAGSKTGKAKITITLASGLRKTINVTVQKGAVTCTSVKNVPKSVSLKKKKSYTLKPVINPITCVQKAKYKTSNKKIATVNGKGKIVAKKKGTAKITVMIGKKKVTCKVKVK